MIKQLLSLVEEEVLVKWALQYHQWGLPLRIYHLDQFASVGSTYCVRTIFWSNPLSIEQETHS